MPRRKRRDRAADMTRRMTLNTPARLLLASTAFLVVGGLIMVYSASSVTDFVKFDDSGYHVKRQALFALAGIVGLVVVSFWDFKSRRGHPARIKPLPLAFVLWSLTTLALVAVEIIGVSSHGATMSLQVGPMFVQPSEYSKLACVMLVAALLVEWDKGRLDSRALSLRLAGVLLPVLLLIVLQPDIGSAAALALAVAMVFWLGGVDARLMGLGIVGGLGIGAVLVKVADYRMDRITAFLDPWADPTNTGYQLIQSLYAFGSGGVVGVGLGLSKQKFFYLPLAYNDFIFAVIGEELGLIGALAFVLAFAVFGYAGMRIAIECRDPFGRLLAGGLTAMIVAQAVMNMAAVTGLMPITGITLPFVSAGGTSLTLSLVCVGLIVAVSRYGGSAKVRLVHDRTGRGSRGSASITERRRDGRSYLSGLDGGGVSPRRRA